MPRSAFLVVALVAAIGGCEDGAAFLAVDVKTDYRPGLEFDRVRVEVTDGSDRGRFVERAVSAEEPFLDGVRVAELDGLTTTGPMDLRVTLTSGATEIITRPVRVTIEGRRVATVVIPRCRVTCPAAANPAATACLGDRCVPPDCTEETPDACGPDACTTPLECAAPSCAEARCVSGSCFAAPFDDRCAASERCDPLDGCHPTTPTVDAGTDAGPPDPDAGIDAGPPTLFVVEGATATAVDGEPVPRGVAADDLGNVYVVGTGAPLDLGGGPAPATSDSFVASFGPGGGRRWSRHEDDADGDWAPGGAAVAGGVLWVPGSYVSTGSVSVAGAALPSSRGFAFARFATDRGAPRGVLYDNATSSIPVIGGVAVDDAGLVYVVASGPGGLDFGGGPSGPDGYAHLLRYTAAGAHQQQGLVRGDTLTPRDIAVDHGGATLLVAGDFQGSIELEPGAPVTSLGFDGFVLAVDASFSRRWHRTFGAAGSDSVGAVAFDGRTTYVGVTTASTMTLGDPVPAGALLVALDDAGAPIWARRFGERTAPIHDLAVDARGVLYVAGVFTTPVDLGGGPLSTASGQGIYVGSLGADGSHRWSRAYERSAALASARLAVTGDGRVVVAATFEGGVITRALREELR